MLYSDGSIGKNRIQLIDCGACMGNKQEREKRMNERCNSATQIFTCQPKCKPHVLKISHVVFLRMLIENISCFHGNKF
jgi:hypothetical protein